MKNLTDEQKEKIRELYQEINNGHEVARRLGLGSTTIYNHLGLQKQNTSTWTDDEIQIMVDGYLEKIPVREIARKARKSEVAVRIRMCRYRKEVKADPKKRRALSAITMAFKAVRKADIYREMEK